MADLSTSLLGRYLRSLEEKEEVLIQRQAEGDERLRLDADAARRAASEGLTNYENMRSPALPEFSMPDAPSGLALLGILMGGNMASVMRGDQRLGGFQADALSGIANQRQNVTQENIRGKREQMMAEHTQRVTGQLKRLDLLAKRAEELGDLEAANKYGRDSLNLTKTQERLHSTALAAGEQEQINARDASKKAAESFEGLDEEAFASHFRLTMDNYIKDGKVTNPKALKVGLASVHKQGDTLDKWWKRLAETKDVFQAGKRDENGDPILSPQDEAILLGYAAIHFPEEYAKRSQAKEQGQGQAPVIQEQVARRQAMQQLLDEKQSLQGELNATGGLSAVRRQRAQKRVAAIDAQLFKLDKARGRSFEVEGTEVSAGEGALDAPAQEAESQGELESEADAIEAAIAAKEGTPAEIRQMQADLKEIKLRLLREFGVRR